MLEKRRLIGILDRKIKAVLSDSYRVMDNYEIVSLALDEFKGRKTLSSSGWL